MLRLAWVWITYKVTGELVNTTSVQVKGARVVGTGGLALASEMKEVK